MKKITVLGVLLLTLLTVTGCAKIPGPKGPDDTLLIGRIHLEIRGYDDSAVSINGKRKSGIEITFREMKTRESFTVRSKQEGLFYKAQVKPGTYFIDSIRFKKTDSIGSWSSLGWDQPLGLFAINIEKGVVTNLGSIFWLADKVKGRYGVIQDQSPEDFRQVLAEEFTGNQWLNRPWNHITFK
jgi:hypothetical protein